MKAGRICLVPQPTGVGGMVSFQRKMMAGLAQRGVDVSYDLDDTPYEAVLVIGGTRQLGRLRRARRSGIRIVQRLDGMNWLHRLRRTGLRHFLRAEYGNALLALIRSRLADYVIYQSKFSKQWWERVRGSTPVPSAVMYNGVDLDLYTPHGPHTRQEDRIRLLLVEGSLMGGYEMGLEVAFEVVEGIEDAYNREAGKFVEVMIAGRVASKVQASWKKRTQVKINWAGLVPAERIPEIDRSAHLLYSADINSACPNSVIEALACGLPVLAYDTGALPEMVPGNAGRIASYGGDPWRLDPPDVDALVEGAIEILEDQQRFRSAARDRAVEVFSLDAMVEGYLHILRQT